MNSLEGHDFTRVLSRVAAALVTLLACDARLASAQQTEPPAIMIGADYQAVTATPWAVQEFGIGAHAKGVGVTTSVLLRKRIVIGLDISFLFVEDRASFTQDVQLCELHYGSLRCGAPMTKKATLSFGGAGAFVGVRHDFALGGGEKGMAVTPMLAVGFGRFGVDRQIWDCSDCRVDIKSTFQGWLDAIVLYGFGSERRFEVYAGYRRSYKAVESALRFGVNTVIPLKK